MARPLRTATPAPQPNADLTPLEFLLLVMRDDGADPQHRLQAATAAAPYCHAQLHRVEHTGDVEAKARAVAEAVLPALARKH